MIFSMLYLQENPRDVWSLAYVLLSKNHDGNTKSAAYHELAHKLNC